MRLALLILLAAVLPACSFGRVERVSGVYEGTIAMEGAALPFEMQIAESDQGHVAGTARLRRGDVLLNYTVTGSRDLRTLRLALADASGDLVLFVTPNEGGRLDGTATGGDLVRAVVQTTRSGALPE